MEGERNHWRNPHYSPSDEEQSSAAPLQHLDVYAWTPRCDQTLSARYIILVEMPHTSPTFASLSAAIPYL